MCVTSVTNAHRCKVVAALVMLHAVIGTHGMMLPWQHIVTDLAWDFCKLHDCLV